MAGMFLFGVFMAAMDYISTLQYGDYEAQITNVLFIYPLVAAILIPAFVSLFVGTEYSDGTIRNKMIIGHTRAGIYLSDLIVCSTAGLGFCISYIIGVFAAGLPLYTIDTSILEGAVKLILCETDPVQFCYVCRIYRAVHPDCHVVPEQGTDRCDQYSGCLLPAQHFDLYHEQTARARILSGFYIKHGNRRNRCIGRRTESQLSAWNGTGNIPVFQ